MTHPATPLGDDLPPLLELATPIRASMLHAMFRRMLLVLLAVACASGAGLAWLRHEPARRAIEFRPAATLADPAQTNVVLVIGCTTRADQTTPYGAPTHVTPFLEELAQQGTRFRSTIAQAPWTRPSVAAILTSRHAAAIGLTEPLDGRNRRALPASVTTLGEHMRASGRATFGFAANPNASSRFGFAQGFDHYWDGPRVIHKVPGRVVVRDALDRVAAHDASGGGAFYLQLLLVDAHYPDESSAVDDARFFEPGLSRTVRRYRARLRRLDASLRMLDAGLAALGHDERNTLFVFVADHGEGLDTPWHHGPSHGILLYSSALGVPWILRGPGVARGHVVEGLAAQLDLLPTLLGVLRLPASNEATGFDWSPQVAGRSDRTTRESVFAETWFRHTERSALYTDHLLCQVDFRAESTRVRQRKLRAEGATAPWFKTACFDLASDPLATRPVEKPELMARVRARHAELQALGADFGGSQEAAIDATTEAQLEALGYAP